MRMSKQQVEELMRNGAKINERLSVTKAGEGDHVGATPLLSFVGQGMLPPLTLERPAVRKGEKVPTEHQEQVALFNFIEQWFPYYPVLQLLFAVPNGAKLPFTRNAKGQRFSRQAKILKDEGLQAGVPDMCFPVPKRNNIGEVVFCGMFIELKRADRKNHPSEEQKWWINQLNRLGYKCVVCYGASEAWNEIRAYLDIGK